MTDSAHLDKVAEAICRAEPDNTDLSDEFVRAVMADYADYYRRVAQAAIDALQLTEEWAVRRGQQGWVYVSGSYDSAEVATKAAARVDKRYWEEHKYVAGAALGAPDAHPVSRIVSPWVRVDGGDA